MIRYRVTQNADGLFGCEWHKVYYTLESDEPISRKEIAKRLGIDICSITDIKIIR